MARKLTIIFGISTKPSAQFLSCEVLWWNFYLDCQLLWTETTCRVHILSADLFQEDLYDQVLISGIIGVWMDMPQIVLLFIS